MIKETIAITGASGLLGSYCERQLGALGYRLILLSRQNKESSISENSVCRQTDYSVEDLLGKLEGAEAVVHLAAHRGEADSLSTYYPNLDITVALYEACCQLEIKNIVYASSISVYGDASRLPWCEEQAPSPTSPYGLSKYFCELLGDYYVRNHGLVIKNLRFAHIYGANEKNNYMINLFMRKAFHSETLVLRAPARARREFLYARDAVRAVQLALDWAVPSGVYNITGKDRLTNLEVACTINQIFHPGSEVSIQDPDADEGIESSFMSGNLAAVQLEYEPKRSMLEALQEIRLEMLEQENVPILY